MKNRDSSWEMIKLEKFGIRVKMMETSKGNVTASMAKA